VSNNTEYNPRNYVAIIRKPAWEDTAKAVLNESGIEVMPVSVPGLEEHFANQQKPLVRNFGTELHPHRATTSTLNVNTLAQNASILIMPFGFQDYLQIPLKQLLSGIVSARATIGLLLIGEVDVTNPHKIVKVQEPRDLGHAGLYKFIHFSDYNISNLPTHVRQLQTSVNTALLQIK
jgi:hypothetical protein